MPSISAGLTVAERIAVSAAMVRQIMQRTGALFAVAQQAAAVETLIAGFWQQGREQSRRVQAVVWTRMAEDGLLDPAVDLAWLIDTASVVAAAETYLLVTRMFGWDLDAYQEWLHRTLTRLVTPHGSRALRPRHGPGLVPCGSMFHRPAWDRVDGTWVRLFPGEGPGGRRRPGPRIFPPAPPAAPVL